MERGLTIAYCKDIRSYTKLIPSLKAYPDATIITIDDDVIYSHDLVERLLISHRSHPEDIIAARARSIVLDKKGLPVRYRRWPVIPQEGVCGPRVLQTGVGGVLYPPHSLHPEVMREEVFSDICSTADDIWFYAMALMNGTHVRTCSAHTLPGCERVCDSSGAGPALLKVNAAHGVNGNDVCFDAVVTRYGLWDKLRE